MSLALINPFALVVATEVVVAFVPGSPFSPLRLLKVKVVVVPLVDAVTDGVPTTPMLVPFAALIVGVVPFEPAAPVAPLILHTYTHLFAAVALYTLAVLVFKYMSPAFEFETVNEVAVVDVPVTVVPVNHAAEVPLEPLDPLEPAAPVAPLMLHLYVHLA